MIAGACTHSRLPPLLLPCPSPSHVPFTQERIVAGVPIPSPGSSSHLLSSTRRPMSRCQMLVEPDPRPSRTHPLIFLCMFRNNVLDLTRDNHLFPFALLDLIVLFSSAGPFFCYSELKTPYVAITCRHPQQTPPDRPPRLSVSCPPPPLPKVDRLFHSRFCRRFVSL